MIIKTSSMGMRPVYYVQKSYRNEDGKPSTKYVETDRRSATASGSERRLTDTSSRGSEDAGDGMRAERSNAE